MAAEVLGLERKEQCEVCKRFHESAVLKCGHAVPYTVVEGNAADMLQGSFSLYPGDMKVQVLRDTGATLIGM